MRLSFEVIGHPEPAGSKRAFRSKTGKMIVTDANPNAMAWKTEVALAADHAMQHHHPGDGRPPLWEGPVGLALVFTLTRPKGHFGTGRNAGTVKLSAPTWPVVKPDCTKLLRGVEDALTGVVYRDDAQVVEQSVSKVYGHPEGVRVAAWTL